ncbi:Hypothetical_protein [Hexamita inflata]|uniref:Hypothetical_protein n=1 Tax=Hexamita inflata TaxID=28002 RepID=A0AA86P4L5_9EUKA|nr:Hypothetical protein HINF_LOCUS19341 [Hexamita inflata]CAI9931700.1 Hypothetical protein HINF_LOCUS19345 [Hexamita inflata]CAI9931704.1 Hypothetical protein HINF_LOCUS19349 [Hexamita inflata]
MKSKYSCVITGFCFMFLALFVGGITIMCIPTEYDYPVYRTYNNDLSYWFTYGSIYLNIGIGLFMVIVGLFGFLISCCFACALRPEKVSKVQEQVVLQQPQTMQFTSQQYQQQTQNIPTLPIMKIM